jgi:hypothetical protein
MTAGDWSRYPAQVIGANGTTGIALMEIYEIP